MSLKPSGTMVKNTPEERLHYTVVSNAPTGRGESGGAIGKIGEKARHDQLGKDDFGVNRFDGLYGC